MNKQYVDAFFDSGSLRLSSFFNFINANDAERFDDEEGRTLLIAKTPQLGGQTITCRYTCKDDAYIFCGSTEYSASLRSKFGDGCIQINDSAAFGVEIAKCIPAFRFGLEGLCAYQERKVIERDLGYVPPDTLRHPDNPSQVNEHAIRELMHKVGDAHVYFLKPIRYLSQREYRLVWLIDGEVRDGLTISCPDARKYCQRPTAWVGVDVGRDGPPRTHVPESTEDTDDPTSSGQTASVSADFPGGWRRRHAICFPPAPSDLWDFSIRLPRGAFNDEICEPNGPFAAQSDGGDLRFTQDKAGNEGLPCDIIQFSHDKSRGERDAVIDIRVKVPLAPSEHCLTLFVWYCTAHHENQPPPDSPWGRHNAYDAHWDSYSSSGNEDRLHDRGDPST